MCSLESHDIDRKDIDNKSGQPTAKTKPESGSVENQDQPQPGGLAWVKMMATVNGQKSSGGGKESFNNGQKSLGQTKESSEEEKDMVEFLNSIIAMARAEDWDAVDAAIPKICNKSIVMQWVIEEGLDDPDGNVRDLAVSILEASNNQLDGETTSKLISLIKEDENVYVQYRSAFALFKRGNRTDVVINKIKEATQDLAIEHIAEGYLRQYGEEMSRRSELGN